jgi:hypothetical protein
MLREAPHLQGPGDGASVLFELYEDVSFFFSLFSA